MNSEAAIQNTPSLSSYYWNITSKKDNDETRNNKEYFQESEMNSLFNPEYMNARNSIWNENDDPKPPKTNINVRIPLSSNKKINKNNQRNPRRIPTKNINKQKPQKTKINVKIPLNSKKKINKNNPRNPRRIPTTTVNMSTTMNQNNQQANLTVQQLAQLLQTHANTVNNALQNQNNNLQNFFNGLNFPQGNGERNLVKILLFKGNDNEDQIELIEFVESAYV